MDFNVLQIYTQFIDEARIRREWPYRSTVRKGQFSHLISGYKPLRGSATDQSRALRKFVFPGNRTLEELCLNGIWPGTEN